MCLSDYRQGFGLDIGFIALFNTQLVITLNYSAIADFHTLHITTAHDKSFPARSVFTSSCLVTDSNNGCFLAEQWLHSNWTILASTVLLITPLHGPSGKHRFQQYLYFCMRIVCRGNVLTESLPRYGSARYNILLFFSHELMVYRRTTGVVQQLSPNSHFAEALGILRFLATFMKFSTETD
jgi:hypothetical protein